MNNEVCDASGGPITRHTREGNTTVQSLIATQPQDIERSKPVSRLCREDGRTIK